MDQNDLEPQAAGLLSADTSSEAERIQLGIWSAMSPLEKVQAVDEITASVRELSFSGIRLRHPTATEEECRLRYAILTLGRPLACAAYPEARALAEH